MPGPTPPMPDMRKRLAAFAGASLLLHAVFLTGVQFANRSAPPPAPDAAPVQMVELPPPPVPPAPQPAPNVPQIPPPPPIPPDAPAPDTQAVVAPAPPAEPVEPTPETEAPNEPEEPQPPASARQAEGAVTVAPDGAAIPGLVYDPGEGSLVDFGQAVACAALEARHDEACADFEPVDVAGDIAPLPANVPADWREEQALEEARNSRLERIAEGGIPPTCEAGDHDCFEQTVPRMRDNPLLRGALPVRDVLRGLGLEE